MLKPVSYIFRFIPLLISVAVAFVSIFPASSARLAEEIEEQKIRISALETAYSRNEIPPVNETSFFDGNLREELNAGMKFNELSCIATHNSYQTNSTEETRKLYGYLEDLTFGIFKDDSAYFASETLTNQLNCGIRSFEMDIEVFDRDGDVSFTCMHSPYIEMGTSCYDFALAMKEIALWSDNNPNHLPITIIIEPKALFLPFEDMKALDFSYSEQFESVLKETLADKLFTPADMLRDYGSFGEMRAADDWCKVSDMLGKVLILLHDCNITEKYIESDPSFKTQAMFPMLREEDINRDCTSFILCNVPNDLLKINNEIKESKVLVRTRADKFGYDSDERRENAFKSGAFIISTDYPPRTDNTEESYFVTFSENKTIKKVTPQ